MDKVNIYLATHHKGFGEAVGYHMELLVAVSEDGEEREETARENAKETRRVEDVTENRLAAIGLMEALKRLRKPCDINILTDNRYILNCINNKWIDMWIKTGFKNGKGEPIKNADVWTVIGVLLQKHMVEVEFIGDRKSKYYDWQKFELRRQAESEEE